MKKISFVTLTLFFVFAFATYAQDGEAPEARTIETTNGVENIAIPTSDEGNSTEEASQEVLGASEESKLIAQEDEDAPEPRTIETEQGTENIAVPTNEDAEFTTQDDQPVPELIAVEDQTFVIYTHEDCPHCAEVEKFVRLNSIEDRVEYKQLKDNEDNLADLEDIWEDFDVSQEEEGWPFMIYTSGDEELYAVGDEPIIDVLSDELGIEDPITEEEGESKESSNSFLLVLGGVFFVAIIGYGAYQFLFSKKE